MVASRTRWASVEVSIDEFERQLHARLLQQFPRKLRVVIIGREIRITRPMLRGQYGARLTAAAHQGVADDSFAVYRVSNREAYLRVFSTASCRLKPK